MSRRHLAAGSVGLGGVLALIWIGVVHGGVVRTGQPLQGERTAATILQRVAATRLAQGAEPAKSNQPFALHHGRLAATDQNLPQGVARASGRSTAVMPQRGRTRTITNPNPHEE